MIRKKKNGFTLVELLAVIVILAIILVIAVPQIMNVIKDTTKASLESSAKMVAAQVENQYTVAQTLGKEFDDTGSCMEEWAGLNAADYASCTYEMVDGTAKVTLVGKGKFKNLFIQNGTRSSATAQEGEVKDNSGVAYITELLAEASDANGLIVDDTDDKNIRYVGSNPNNYVYFNCEDTYNGKSYGSDGYEYDDACEIWRIIGIFDVKTNKSDTQGTKRIKIVRDTFTDSQGNTLLMSWDSSAETINYGYGINEWSQADLKSMLNGYYLGTSDTCTYCNDSNQGTCSNNCTNDITPLSSTSKKMVGQAVWSTRGIEEKSYTSKEMYEAERTSTETGKACTSSGTEYDYCNDTVQRKNEWEGKIGLIYPSDYGYASTDEECEDITNLYGTCRQNNWLKVYSNYWTMSSYADSDHADLVCFEVDGISNTSAVYNTGVRPALYLKSNIKIIGGDGSDDLPYRLAI